MEKKLVKIVEGIEALFAENGLKYSTKIGGQVFVADFTRMDVTWLDAMLTKAAQRLVNDTLSGLEPGDKVAEAAKMFGEINSGEAKPQRVTVKKTVDPVMALAMKNAKEWLKRHFIAQGFGNKIAEWTGHEVVGKYFTDAGVWVDDVVLTFIDANEAKLAFRKNAEAELAKAEKVAEEVTL